MRIDDRFDDLVASLGGFYRTWYVVSGLELGLFARLREAGSDGMAVDELALGTGTDADLIGRWAWGAAAHDLVDLGNGRLYLPEEVATILVDAHRPEYLGGQFLHAAISSLDFADLPDVLRTGRPRTSRPDRYRVAIERLTVQDIAVFFQEVLPALPQLVLDLIPGSRIADIHCGGGRWLIAMARRFPGTQLTGVEFEPDSVARARAAVESAALADRITVEQGDLSVVHHEGEVSLAYFQHALHLVGDPVGALRSAWASLKPGGWLVSLDWHLPSDPDDLRTHYSELMAGIQLDELLGGTHLVTRSEALGWFAEAEVPIPELIDLPSGATAIVARR